MEEELEIILRAVDEASSTFQSVTESAEEMGASFEEGADEASSGFDELEASAESATGSIQDVIDYCNGVNGDAIRETADAADELEKEAQEASDSARDMGDSLGIINSGMLLQTAEQIKGIGANAEGMAQDMNEAAITVGQLATQTGIAEPQLVSMINNISNATFPNEEAMMYVKSLDQMGVASENFAKSATDLDRINDAFGLGAQTTNSLGQELGVLGVDMNNVSTAFNALAYANANTVGGMNNYYSFLRKYDSQFKELGYNVDQASVIISAATQKFGGGRAALSGLSNALNEAGTDTAALEQALDMEAGSIDNATSLTGQYEGQLMQLAGEEAQHKTILDQMGAAWEDFSLSMSGVLSPLSSAIGFIGQVGSFGLSIKGLKELGTALRSTKTFLTELNIVQSLHNAIEGEGVIAYAASALGITTEAAAAEGATTIFGGLAIAEGAALWPLLAIIAAAALVVAAIYEIGKAFGWWTDVGSMIDAIWAGLNRLWSAFINHPDVQAAIQILSDVFQALASAIGWAFNAILEFFGVSTGGDFDIVRALIEGIGKAWEMITWPIRVIINMLKTFYQIGQLVASGQIDLITGIRMAWSVFATAMDAIFGVIINAIANFASSMISRGVNAARGFVNGIIARIKALPGKVLAYLVKVASTILRQGNAWVRNARNRANQTVKAVVNYIKNLPRRVGTYITNTANNIANGAKAWINNARTKAQETVKAVTEKISGLPGKVYEEFVGIGTKIKNAVPGAVRAATNFGNDIKTAVLKALHIASPGIIQNKIATEFEDTVGQIEDAAKPGYNAGQAFGNAIVSGFGDPTLSLGNGLSNYNVGGETALHFVHDHNYNFTGLPDTVSAEEVASMINQAALDDEFTKALAGNKRFQLFDSKAKQRLSNRKARSRGV